MIQVSRSLARHLRAVFRRLTGERQTSRGGPAVELRADRQGLHVCYRQVEVATQYHQAGSLVPDVIYLPLDALADFEGRDEGLVTLQRLDDGRTEARWEHRGMPFLRDYAALPAPTTPLPSLPKTWKPNDPALLAALDAAVQTTARDAVRYALTRLQVCGARGDVIATDGKQLLIQNGFAFPWSEEILVARSAVFGCKELPANEPIHVGRTDTDVCLRVGAWTFWLAIDRDGRYPRPENVIPTTSASSTRLCLDPADAAALVTALPALPGAERDAAPLTVDLDGQVAVRARGEQGRTTELLLARSQATGQPVRFCTERYYLARAARLGFQELMVAAADRPVVGRDGTRTYVWMTLGKEGALAPQPGDRRIRTAGKGQARPEGTRSRPRAATMASAAQRTPARQAPKEEEAGEGGPGNRGLVEEAAEVQRLLREALERLRRLMAAVRLQHKQQRWLRSTLASLRQVQQLNP